MSPASRVIGLALAVGLAFCGWYVWSEYQQFANVGRWAGDRDLNWLRPWLTEFRTPLLCAGGFLILTFVSWIWQKLKLGH